MLTLCPPGLSGTLVNNFFVFVDVFRCSNLFVFVGLRVQNRTPGKSEL